MTIKRQIPFVDESTRVFSFLTTHEQRTKGHLVAPKCYRKMTNENEPSTEWYVSVSKCWICGEGEGHAGTLRYTRRRECHQWRLQIEIVERRDNVVWCPSTASAGASCCHGNVSMYAVPLAAWRTWHADRANVKYMATFINIYHNLAGNSKQVTWLAVIEVRSVSAHLFAGYVAPPGECYYNIVLCCTYYFHRRVWYRALSPYYACTRHSGIILIP